VEPYAVFEKAQLSARVFRAILEDVIAISLTTEEENGLEVDVLLEKDDTHQSKDLSLSADKLKWKRARLFPVHSVGICENESGRMKLSVEGMLDVCGN